MTITLYLNSAENNRVDKTAYLEELLTLTGSLRDGSSMLEPNIIFELPQGADSAVIDEDDEEVNTPDGDIVIQGEDVYRFNYVYIHEFNRYYYVDDIFVSRTKLYNVALSVDVLMSTKDALLSLPAYIDRNEFDNDPYLYDNLRPFEEKTEITYTQADAGNIQFSTDRDWLEWNFVANMIVGNAFFSGKPIDIPWTASEKMYPETFQGGNTIPYILNKGRLNSVLFRAVVGQDGDKVYDFVASAIAFPFEIPRDPLGTLQDVHYQEASKTIKDTNDQFVKGYIPRANTSDYLIAGYLDIPSISSYQDLPPYTRREIYLPFYGWYELDIQKTAGHRLTIYYVANYQDGSAMVFIRDNSNGMIIFSNSCQLGVKIPTTQTNLQEITINKNALNTQLAISLVSGALTLGIGASSGNAMMVAGGAMSVPRAINSYVAESAKQFHHASVSFGGGAMSLYSPLRIWMRTTKLKTSVDDESLYAHEFGKPLAQARYLYSLSGYTTISNIHLENLPAFKEEKNEMESLLKSGVIL